MRRRLSRWNWISILILIYENDKCNKIWVLPTTRSFVLNTAEKSNTPKPIKCGFGRISNKTQLFGDMLWPVSNRLIQAVWVRKLNFYDSRSSHMAYMIWAISFCFHMSLISEGIRIIRDTMGFTYVMYLSRRFFFSFKR